MELIAEVIRDYLFSIPDNYAPIRDHAIRYQKQCCSMDEDEIVRIGENPEGEPNKSLFTLFPPAQPGWFWNWSYLEVPDNYREFLLIMNGCQVYDLFLCGFTPTQKKYPPTADRAVPEWLDLRSSLRWWVEHGAFAPGQFVFGFRHLDSNRSLGYFMDQRGHITAQSDDGRSVQKWISFLEFLKQEVALAEHRVLHHSVM